MSDPISSPSKRYSESIRLHEAAKNLMPGGVNSPVRAFKAVGGSPIAIRDGQGCRVTDANGNQYVDYIGSYGPLILGHAADCVVEAVRDVATRGLTFGMPTELENRLAEKVIAAVPSIRMVRFVNSGTEAVMSAIRLARGATGRTRIIKCIGAYHGHADAMLVQAGSGATTLGTPSSPGVPASTTSQTLLVHYNDLEGMRALFEQYSDEIAGVIVEPVAGNMGCVRPQPGYLQSLRKLCTSHGSLLIFDEVMTGFRVHYGGAQSLYGVEPDITTLGKIVGGGLPCAAYGGSEELMRRIAPDGPIYQAGTLSGNPLAMAAGLATLNALDAAGVYEKLEASSAALAAGLSDTAKVAGVGIHVNRVGSMLTPFFTNCPVSNYEDATASDVRAFATFFKSMLDQGVMLPPSQFEAWFVSTAHDQAAIELTIEAAKKAFAVVAGSR